jgi:hypothetical protein
MGCAFNRDIFVVDDDDDDDDDDDVIVVVVAVVVIMLQFHVYEFPWVLVSSRI